MKKSILSLPGQSQKRPKGTISGIVGRLLIVILICTFAVPAVSADEALGASFTFSPTSPTAGEAVTFSGSATWDNITTWTWDFGDNSAAGSGKSATHTYTEAGSFTVQLIVSDGTETSPAATNTVTVVAAAVPPKAAFTWSPTSTTVGQAVTFTDTSTGDVTTWSWNFGDGETSEAQSPSHPYSAVGTYPVTLTVANTDGTSSEVTQFVTVAAATAGPVASFSYSPQNPKIGEKITFTDTSSGSPDGWYWDFGNGQFSVDQIPPTQTYTSVGTYEVSLVVSRTNVGTSVEFVKRITVGEESLDASFTYSPSSPDAGDTITFTDTSSGSPTDWEWDFGDNTGSEDQYPRHKYNSDGTYSVKLTVRKSGLTSKPITKTITVGDATPTPTGGPVPDADFKWSANPVVGQAVSFTDMSTGTGINKWKWDFDDRMDFSGNRESDLQNPSHTYSSTGSYQVTLTVWNSGGGKDIIEKTVNVGTVRTSAQFNTYPSSGTAPLSVRFVDASTGAGIRSWHWDFGNGRTYEGESPSNIVYTSPGRYTVSLEIEDGSGHTDEYTKIITVDPPTTATLAQAATPTPTAVPAAEDTGFVDGEYRKMTGLYNEYIKILFGFLGIDDEPDFLIIAVNGN